MYRDEATKGTEALATGRRTKKKSAKINLRKMYLNRLKEKWDLTRKRKNQSAVDFGTDSRI